VALQAYQKLADVAANAGEGSSSGAQIHELDQAVAAVHSAELVVRRAERNLREWGNDPEALLIRRAEWLAESLKARPRLLGGGNTQSAPVGVAVVPVNHRQIRRQPGYPLVYRRDPYWRSRYLYRMDRRRPDRVFQTGFRPRNSANLDLPSFVYRSRSSAFVATSSSSYYRGENLPTRPRYRYYITAPGGIDVNASGMGWRPAEFHISFAGGIRSSYIRGAYDIYTNRWSGNPNYGP
jgi:hypothetical protein